MKPSQKTIDCRGSNLPRTSMLGTGLYAEVYDQGDGTVVKFSSAMDGTSDYIHWCWKRTQRGGCMDGMPEVSHYGEFVYQLGDTEYQGWWCVMPKYESFGDGEVACGLGHVSSFEVSEDIAQVAEAALGVRMSDRHRGNVMWDGLRKCFVLTDPSSHDSKRVSSSIARKLACSTDGYPSLHRHAMRNRVVVSQPRPAVWAVVTAVKADTHYAGWVPRQKRIAAWKIPQLHQLHHMRA